MKKYLYASAALISFGGIAQAQPVTPVAPGTIVVHFRGALQFEIGDYGSTFNQVGADKLNPISTDGDARLYAGFDAQTLNGVEYGAQIETRVTTSDDGVGAGKASGAAGTNGTSSVYIKRAYGYLGTPNTGFVRAGQSDSAFGLFQAGVLSSFGDGQQFNADGGTQDIVPTSASPQNFIYADTSHLYATDKVIYISPTLAGFAFAAGYEPNSNGLKEGYADDSTANSDSAALSSSPTATDTGSRRKNTVDAMLQFKRSFGPVSYKASAGFLYGATVNYVGVPVALGKDNHFGYDPLSVYQAGAQAGVGGLTLGANLKGGEVRDDYSFEPRGARNAFSYIVGATYQFGPYVLGANYFNGQTAGNYIPGKVEARTLSEYGVAVGANYVLSQHLDLFLQYLYGHRHQPGDSSLSATGNAQMQIIASGADFTF